MQNSNIEARMAEPDFYLASSDSYILEKPRRVWSIKRMSIPSRDDLLLVRITPPVRSEACGPKEQDIDIVLLATRRKGASLFPIREWPVAVYVIRPLIDDIAKRDKLNYGEFENMAWAEVYKSEDDARSKIFTTKGQE